MDRSVKIDDKTYKELSDIKKSTGVPIKRIIKDSVAKKQKENKNGRTSIPNGNT